MNGVTTYAIAPVLAGSDPVIGAYEGVTVYQLGVSPTGNLGSGALAGNPTTGMAMGRNVIDVGVENANYPSLGDPFDLVGFVDDSAAGDLLGSAAGPNLILDETYYQGGDSGAPTFVVNGLGQLELIGVHSLIDDMDLNNDTINDRRFSGDVFLPNYRNEIFAVSGVPEPSSVLPLMCFLVTFVCRFRRSR